MTATRLGLCALAFLSLSLAAAAREPQGCRVDFPNYAPQDADPPAAAPVRYPGGAWLSRPVAAPCPRVSRSTRT